MRIDLPANAIEALQELALLERRDPRREAERLIIRALYRRGLVSADGQERRKRLYPKDEPAEAVEQQAESASPPARLARPGWN